MTGFFRKIGGVFSRASHTDDANAYSVSSSVAKGDKGFLDEVIEDVRRERIFNFLQQRWKILFAVFVLFVLGIFAWQAYGNHQDQRMMKGGGRYVELNEMEPTEEVASSFLALSEYGNGYDVFGRIQAASVYSQLGDIDKALEIRESITQDSGVARVYRHVARLQNVLSQFSQLTNPVLENGSVSDDSVSDSNDAIYAAIEKDLPFLIVDKRAPFRPLALELSALLKVLQDDWQGALIDVQSAQADKNNELPSGLTYRLTYLEDMIKARIADAEKVVGTSMNVN